MQEGSPIFERKKGIEHIENPLNRVLAVALERTIERLENEGAVKDYLEEMLKYKDMPKEFLDYVEFRRIIISLGLPYEIPYKLRCELCD